MLFRLVLIPMTLFSGTFFPVDRLPGAIQPVTWVSPLWHGTELARAAALGGGAALPAVGHAAVLAGAGRGRVGTGRRALPAEVVPMTERSLDTAGAGRAAAAPPPLPLLARLLPAGSYAGRPGALVRRSATAARRTWLAIVSGIFEPVFYLVAMGQGLGSLIGTLPGPDGTPISTPPSSPRGCSPRPP